MAEREGKQDHAPRSEGLLFPLGIASLLLGMLFIVFWVLLGFGLDAEAPDVDAASVVTRRWILISIGSFLTLQGVALVGVRLARSEALGAGQARTRLLMNVILMVVLGTVLLALVNYIFSRHEVWRVDLTSQRLYTLSEESKALAKALDKTVRVAVLVPRGAGELDSVERLLVQYQHASAKVEVVRYDPRTMDTRELKLVLEELDLDPDLREAELLGLVVQSGRLGDGGQWIKGRAKHLALQDLWERDVTDPSRRVFMGERLISSAIREVTGSGAPKVYFLTGHGEVDIEDFEERTSISRLVKLLRQRNVDVEKLDLLEREKVDVPADCDLLVVVGPKKALTEAELRGLAEWLDRGGRGMFLLEAWYRRADEGTRFDASGLEGLLQDRYGVEAVDESVFLMFKDSRFNRLTADHQLICNSLDSAHKITQPLALREARIAFYSSRPLQARPTLRVHTKDLVTTASWGQRCFATPDPSRKSQTAELMRRGPFTIALAAEFEPDPEAKEPELKRAASRVVIFGDMEWVTNQFLRERAFFNQELFLNAFNWLLKREELMVGETHRPTSYRLSMTEGTLRRIQLIAFPGLPIVALALGIFAWVIRSRS